MADALIIPVEPLHRFFFEITLDGNEYRFRFHWNQTEGAWYLDIKGISNDIEIGLLKLVPGLDLLSPFGYSELGSLWIIDREEQGDDPNFEDFGDRFVILYEPKE